jgi:thiol-disulfide isomerase/thioredoxin
MRRLILPLAAVALVAVVVIGLSQAGGDSGPPRPGGPTLADAQRRLAGAPPALADLHKQASQLVDADVDTYDAQLLGLRGHPVVVNAWATWCGPCKVEFPIFQRVSVRRGREVAFLGLNTGDNNQRALRFLRRFPVSYPSLTDPGFRIAQRRGYGRALPVTKFYDRDGKMAYIHNGQYRTERQLERDIDRYLR